VLPDGKILRRHYSAEIDEERLNGADAFRVRRKEWKRVKRSTPRFE
jgi:hypothetical protein